MDAQRGAARLRDEIGRLGERGRGRAYPEALRLRAIAYVDGRKSIEGERRQIAQCDRGHFDARPGSAVSFRVGRSR